MFLVTTLISRTITYQWPRRCCPLVRQFKYMQMGQTDRQTGGQTDGYQTNAYMLPLNSACIIITETEGMLQNSYAMYNNFFKKLT